MSLKQVSMPESTQQIFSEEVIQNVRSTWKEINGDLQQLGISVFLNIFKTYPDYQTFFISFKDVSHESLKENASFKRHTLTVATALNTAVENLDKPDVLVPLLNKIGKSHAKRNLTPETFHKIQTNILNSVVKSIGDKATDQVQASWNEVLAVTVSTIMKGAEERST